LVLTISLSVSRCPVKQHDTNANLSRLKESGNLQATVFIQIATSLFERMECILGLPRDARINKREVDCDGLLGDENFSKIAKLVFSKMEFDQSENVEGGIKSLRKSLKKVRQLLRERIAP
jgi:hypothetical protein